MRLLWSLPKAAPALLRHMVAYAELVVQDIERMQRDFGARMVAGAIVGASIFFVMMSSCILVVALTWDTPHRVAAVLWMGGAFLLVAAVALAYRSQVLNSQAPFLGTVRREWSQDRVILDHILSPGEE